VTAFLLATLCCALGGSTRDGQQILAECGFQGGLVVQVGCGNADPLLGLAQTPNALVHGLVSDPERVEAVRHGIRHARIYGRVSVMAWQGPFLPYADGMVNVLLSLDERVTLAPAEIDRVLAPYGIAWLQRNGKLTAHRKAPPADVDEWSHSRYDATGNAVSKDKRVGPPRFLQWEGLPRWNRGVKTSSMVSTHGRLFFILDDSAFDSDIRTWSLIARDAYNGIQLWRRELSAWPGAKGGKKVGPAQVHRRLVASGDRVYATLADPGPVSVLNAADGQLLRTLSETEPAEEMILSAGILVALVNPNTAADLRRGAGQNMRLVAVDPDSGKTLWKHPAALIMPLTLAADGKQVVYHDGKAIVSLDLRTGAHRWTSTPTGQKIAYHDQANSDRPGAEPSTIVLAPQFAPTLILYGDVVAFAGGRRLVVVSAANGTELWRADYAPSGYSVPVDLFGFQGCLWGPDAEMNLWRPLDDNLDVVAYDPLTGAVQKTVTGKYGYRFQHHRCHQMKVVDDMLIAGRAGIEFLDTDTGQMAAHHWARGSCYFGVLPANGLLYLPPHDCACYIRAKLSGFLALKSQAPARRVAIPDEQRLVPGPAFGQTQNAASRTRPDDWPTFRHDAARSGRARVAVGADLLLGWQTQLEGALTSPVIADGRAYLASRDQHVLHALQADTGQRLWQHQFDSRVDSPPTVYDGLLLCGCRDGSVVALRAADGALVWRFRAAPAEQMIVSRGQLESVWPVPGSVLVLKGIAYFAAGRSSYLDGGLRLYGVDAHTGRKQLDRTLWTRDADGCELLDEQGVDGFLNDILSSDGQRIFMRHHVLDLSGVPQPERIAHLHGPDGYLSADTTSRLLWTYAPMATSPHQGAFYDGRLSRTLFPSGRILVEDDTTIYGFGQNHYNRARPDPGGQWALFAAEKQSDVALNLTASDYRKLALSGQGSVRYRWWKDIPIQAWAMVHTEQVLFVAGPVDSEESPAGAQPGKSAGALLAVAPADGRLLATLPLPSLPVWDGMAAAAGNLYLALADGQVLCLWSAASGRPGQPLSLPAARSALPPLQVAEEPGLIGRWRFDEGTGKLARDCSGHGHDARIAGRWAAGDFGTCLVAAGAARAAAIPDAPHLHFANNNFTLALWVKADGHDTRLIGKEAFPENWWVINILANGRAELVLGTGRGPVRSARAATTAALATDAWIHLAACVDRQAREVRWYVNGEIDSRHPIPETMTQGLDAAGSEIIIASKHKPFRGLVSDLRIYREALSAQRAHMLYEQEAD